MRKIIQLLDTGGQLRALCEDGSLWRLMGETWKRVTLPAVPQEAPQFVPFVAADYLDNVETISAYLKSVLEDPESTKDLLQAVLKDVIDVLGKTCVPSYNGDAAFLTWLHNRLQYQHGEHPTLDYMHRLRSIILATPSSKSTHNLASNPSGLPAIMVEIQGHVRDGYQITPIEDTPWPDHYCGYPTYQTALVEVNKHPEWKLAGEK